MEALLSEEHLLPENEEVPSDDAILPAAAADVPIDYVDNVEQYSDTRLDYYIEGYVARKRIFLTHCDACKDAGLLTRQSVLHKLPAEAGKQWGMEGGFFTTQSVCLYWTSILAQH